jgi:TonB family protein
MLHTHTTGLNRYGVALFLLSGLAAPALGAAEGDNDTLTGDVADVTSLPGSAEQALDFDIPSQPLASALQRYALISGRPALFSSAMVAGRSSNTVHGSHTPEAALNLLLEGSGLVAQKGREGPDYAFVLKAIGPQADAGHPETDGLDIDYGGWVQARVWDALCANARTAPGGYRVLLRFEVDASGRIQRARLLTSTGNARRDAAVLDTLQHVQVDRSPPPGMAQPLTMILLPHDRRHPDDGASSCSNNGGNHDRAAQP